LDTSAYSAFFRGHEGVIEALREADLIGLCPIVLGELKAGFLRGSRWHKNEAELAEFMSSPRVRFFSIDEESPSRYAAIFSTLLKAGTPVPTNDLWIAACAMQNGLEVLTTDKHFKDIPQVVARWFAPDPE
jgi:predicted nucleic acid-binding protein